MKQQSTNKRGVLFIFLAFTAGICESQATQSDQKVVVDLAPGSNLTLAVSDTTDLKALREYDYNALVEDIISKIEINDTTKGLVRMSSYTRADSTIYPETQKAPATDRKFVAYSIGTRSCVNFDFGTSNYLLNGSFPDQADEVYTVQPWGSWYLAINLVQRTKVIPKFKIEWGGGLSWNNFRFQRDNISVSKDPNGVVFEEDMRDLNFKRSKISMVHLNVFFVPMIDFGDGRGGNQRKITTNQIRLGIGPYAGYRIDGSSRLVYKQDGSTRHEKTKENIFLNNTRYGMRFQLGFNSWDIFVNYDMSPLFSSGKGPDLNPFSFGISF